MTAAFPLPPQTGRADFPHPAFAWYLIWSIHRSSGFGFQSQRRSSVKAFVLLWDCSNQCRHLLSRPYHAKAPLLHRRYPASSLLRASPTPILPMPILWIRCALCRACGATGNMGLPGCPTQPSLRADLSYPGKSRRCRSISLHGGFQASAHPIDWPLSLGVTRLSQVRLRCGSQV